MTPPDEFAALPPAVQFELLQIAREAMSMSAGDKGHAAAMFATVGLHFGQRPESDDNDRFIPGALMVSALGVLLKVAHNHELTTKEID